MEEDGRIQKMNKSLHRSMAMMGLVMLFGCCAVGPDYKRPTCPYPDGI